MARTSARDLASALLLALGVLACAIDGALMARADALALEALAAVGVLAWVLDLRAQRRGGRRVRGLRRVGAALALAFLALAPSPALLGRRGERIRTAIVEHEAVHGSLPDALDGSTSTIRSRGTAAGATCAPTTARTSASPSATTAATRSRSR